MSIDLIPAALVHAELLAAMHKVCFAEPWSADSMAGALGMPGSGGLIAVEAGSLTPSLGGPGPAGFVLWRVAADEAEILSIAVLPPWRRRGLGARLLEAAAAAAREGGAATLFLEAAAGNSAALSLYESHEFRRTGRRKGYYGGDDAVIMARNL